MRKKILLFSGLLSYFVVQSCEPVFAVEQPSFCQSALNSHSPEFMAGLSLSESLHLDRYILGDPNDIYLIPAFNRSVLMMTNAEMELALRLMLNTSESNGSDLAMISAGQKLIPFVRPKLFEKLSKESSLETFGDRSDAAPPKVIELALNSKSGMDQLALFIVDQEIYVGPANYILETKGDEPDWLAGVGWPIKPEIDTMYRVINSKLANLLRAWAFR